VDVTEQDINKHPPDRAFLERHVDEARFLDFVSRRSPVFKQRPLPKTKKEAIDLMVKQPNLIRRPILVRAGTAIFGFDREQYDRLAASRT
jgi:arsenate reductase-like glutaredoxin family protein